MSTSFVRVFVVWIARLFDLKWCHTMNTCASYKSDTLWDMFWLDVHLFGFLINDLLHIFTLYMAPQDLNTAAALATESGYAVTAQVIMGYAPEFKLGGPVINFIDNEMYGPIVKKEPKGMLGKLGNFLGSLFGSTTNEDGTIRRGCLSALGEKVSRWRKKFDDFEFKDLFKKKSNSTVVFPDDDVANPDEESPVEPVFEF
jgi:hypothetical protein